MQTATERTGNKHTSNLKTGWKQKILTWLHLTDELVVKVYRGYGRTDQFIVQGHVFRLSPLPRKKYRQTVLTNTFALLRLFFVRSQAGATVRINWFGQNIETLTDKDGHFRLEWKSDTALSPGWHPVQVDLLTENTRHEGPLATGMGKIHIPHPTQYAFISDIDDTFLISHSSTILKRLYVLLTENAHSRDPFEDVVTHYQLLAEACTDSGITNAFFYVSSSEWNLYDYILEFSEKNGLPEGVYLLNQLKRLNQIWKTGQSKHMTKFTRIVRILESFPDQKFILLGDDTQEDPSIYSSIVSHFPGQIRCVYLRRVQKRNQEETQVFVDKIEAAGVHCCYFSHSSEAIRHSKSIGLVDPAV